MKKLSFLLLAVALIFIVLAIWVIPALAEKEFTRTLSHSYGPEKSEALAVARFGLYGLPPIIKHLQGSSPAERRLAAYILTFYGEREVAKYVADLEEAVGKLDEKAEPLENRPFGVFGATLMVLHRRWHLDNDAEKDEQMRIHLHVALALASPENKRGVFWLKDYLRSNDQPSWMFRALALVGLYTLKSKGLPDIDMASIVGNGLYQDIYSIILKNYREF